MTVAAVRELVSAFTQTLESGRLDVDVRHHREPCDEERIRRLRAMLATRSKQL